MAGLIIMFIFGVVAGVGGTVVLGYVRNLERQARKGGE
ncbi:hypothetical protein [Kosakonia phage Kc166B]|nr:hypothetical protein [Kosakonia phage Kc237]QQV88699.1 hypothetical protein [Kosakonia phage Kc166B]